MLILQILLNSVVTSTQVLLVAAGLYLTYRVARIVNIMLAGILVVAPYTFYAFVQAGAPAWAGVIGGLGGALGAGLVNFMLLREYAVKRQPLLGLLVGATAWIGIESFLGILFGSDGKFLIQGVLPTLHWGGLQVTWIGLWSLLIGLAVVAIALFVLYLLPVGRVIRAVKQHPECATVIGIREKRVQAVVFLVSAFLAGIVGLLVGMNNALTPSAATPLILTAFIALLVGGVHDFRGTVVAVFLLVLIPEMMISFPWEHFSPSNSWKMVILFVLALMLLAVRPQGIFAQSLRRS